MFVAAMLGAETVNAIYITNCNIYLYTYCFLVLDNCSVFHWLLMLFSYWVGPPVSKLFSWFDGTAHYVFSVPYLLGSWDSAKIGKRHKV